MDRDATISPKDLRIGNFFYAFGNIEIVTGIVPREVEGDYYICHNSWNQDEIPLPDDMKYSPEAIPLTEEWKKCLNIDKHQLPDFIEHVHEAQNYLKFCCGVESLEIMDWDLFGTVK